MEVEVVVALVTITLFIPCIANFLMIVKERGWRTGAAVAGFILPFSVAVGAVVNQLMRWTWL
jgi:ferrous iron transport protein B